MVSTVSSISQAGKKKLYFYAKGNLNRGDSGVLQWKSLTTGEREGNVAALKCLSALMRQTTTMKGTSMVNNI